MVKHFVLLSSVILYFMTSYCHAAPLFSSPRVIVHEQTDHPISYYLPNPYGYLRAQSTTCSLYEFNQQGLSVTTDYNTIPFIEPNVIEFNSPVVSKSWQSSSNSYYAYKQEYHNINSTTSYSQLLVQVLYPGGYRTDGYFNQGQFIIPFDYWARVYTNYERRKLYLTNTSAFYYHGYTEVTQTTEKQTPTITDSIVDSTNSIDLISQEEFPDYILGWDQDTDSFMTLRQEGNTIICNDIAHPTSSTLSVHSSLADSSIELATKRDDRYALAFSKPTAAILTFNSMSTTLALPSMEITPTNSTIWIDENGDLQFFSKLGVMAFFSSPASSSGIHQVANSGETVLAGHLNHFSATPIALFLVETASGSHQLRLVELIEGLWVTTNLPHFNSSLINPESLAFETTHDAGMMIIAQTTAPENKFYLLTEIALSEHSTWITY